MLLILTLESDITTNKVIPWLSYLGIKFYRINTDGNQMIDIEMSIAIETGSAIVNNPLEEYSLWYRKIKSSVSDKREHNLLLSKLHLEYYSSFYFNLPKIADKYLGNLFLDINTNKVDILNLAVQEGLDIPSTLITNNKRQLLEFIARRSLNKVITKCASNTDFFAIVGKRVAAFTYQLTANNLNDMQGNFGMSLFQESIEKDFDIKTFFIDGSFYTQAIISDSTTNIDIRIAEANKSHRVSNYKLPQKIEKLVSRLMNRLMLNIGTIDFVKGVDGKYYFLEINPSGQFDNISYFGNYYLEKKVATFFK